MMRVFFPANEAETLTLYQIAEPQLGWRIVHLQIPFPDAVIENGDGQRLVAEFEYEARNFRKHKHDPAGCDLIVCWSNNWPDAPVPVWELKGRLKTEAQLIRSMLHRRKPIIKWLPAPEDDEDELAIYDLDQERQRSGLRFLLWILQVGALVLTTYLLDKFPIRWLIILTWLYWVLFVLTSLRYGAFERVYEMED